MPYYKFEKNDVFHNRIKTYPSCEFFIHNGSTYYNNEYSLEGTYTTDIVIDKDITLPSPQTMQLNGPIYNVDGVDIIVEDGATLTINDDVAPDDNPVRHMPSGHISLYELNIDRVELRRRNMIPADAFPYKTPLGLTYDGGLFERNLDEGLRRIEYVRASPSASVVKPAKELETEVSSFVVTDPSAEVGAVFTASSGIRPEPMRLISAAITNVGTLAITV